MIEKKEQGIFIIRDTFTEKVKHEIPKYLMEYSPDKVTETVHRFKWENNTTLRLINSEGFERLVKLDGKFTEIQFHAIPLYKSYWSTHNHYYYEKPRVGLGDV